MQRRVIDLTQAELFAPAWPQGLRQERDFLSPAEERALLQWIATLDLRHAEYKGYSARRRVASFGSRYDFAALALRDAPALPGALQPLRERAAAWAGLDAAALAHALVAEYASGTPLGWHRDVPDYEHVVGISLGSDALMQLRPWPPKAGAAQLELVLVPRSIYLLQGPARWAWQHRIAATRGARWSITLRTRRQA